MMPRVIKNGMKWMPSFCNVLFFSTSKKLRREFLTNTGEETSKNVRDLNFNHFLLSPNTLKKSKKSLDRRPTFGLAWQKFNTRTSVVSLIFLHKNLSDWPILLPVWLLPLCLSVCLLCADIRLKRERQKKTESSSIVYVVMPQLLTPRHRLRRKSSFLKRQRRRQFFLLMLVAIGIWNFLPGFLHVFTGMYKAHGRRYFGGYIKRPTPCKAEQLAPEYLLDKPKILPNLDDPDLSNLPGQRVHHPKVGIIVICDGNVHSICASSVANKQAYADRHGYDMIYDEKIVDSSRPASWSKLLAMRKYLPKYDFLLYLDVDTVIVNFDVQLEDIVDYEYDQILAADRNGLNCGVWMIRNTEWSLWFLDEMWSQSQLVGAAPWQMLFHFEQRAFHYLYQTNIWRQKVGGEQFEKANTVRARTKVVNACVFNSQLAFYEDGDFLIHLAGLKGVYKCLTFRRYYKNALNSLEKYGSLSVEADELPPSLRECFFGNTWCVYLFTCSREIISKSLSFD